ncbi:MAG TPA: hypothetical protein VF942_15915 [Acidimicrobiales bacterium]
MRWLRGFVRFWYDFVIGDDWSIAAGVAIAVIATFTLAHAGVGAAWVLLPAIVALGLTVSVWRGARRRPG